MNPGETGGQALRSRIVVMVLALALGLTVVGITLVVPARQVAKAGVLCVKPGGGDGCQDTIQAAVDLAMAGDTIQVAAGDYTGYVVITKTLTLQGGWAPDFSVRDLSTYTSTIKPPVNTVNPQSVVSIQGQNINTSLVAPTLDGFVITGGRADLGSNHGGGLRIQDSDALVISNTIRDNRAFLLGGGVWVQRGAPMIQGNTIISNMVLGLGQEAYGGGVQLENAQATLEGNLIIQNVVTGTQSYGGGIDMGSVGLVMLSNNTIISNTATSGLPVGLGGGSGEGAGVSTRGMDLLMEGDIVSGNVALTNGGGLYVVGTLTATNATIANNAASISRGGGIYMDSPFGNIRVIDSFLNGNQAGDGGGAIFFDATVQSGQKLNPMGKSHFQAVTPDAGPGGLLWLENSTLLANSAAGDGGGLSLSSGVATITNTTFEGNQAAGSGGAMDARNSQLALSDSTLKGNRGGDGGALYLSVGQTSLIHNSVISGNTADFNAGALLNTSTAKLTITHSTIANNSATDSAGAIENSGLLSISESQIDDNSAGADGGAVLNVNGVLSLQSTAVRGNTASVFGGAIWNFQAGAVHFAGGEIFDNQAVDGGGIYNRGRVSLDRVDVYSNSAMTFGGGIFTDRALTLTHVLVHGNQADDGAGIFAEGGSVTTILNSTVSGNTTVMGGGAGINNNGRLLVRASTFSGNQTTSMNGNGGGILNNDLATIENSTVSGNVAGGFGGGIRNAATITLTNATVANNTGALGAGGVQNMDTALAVNTLIAANSPDNCSDPLNSLGHNLEDADTCGLVPGMNDLIGLDPLLGPLADNGGIAETSTHALGPGSPAIDAGDNAACLPTDQRGGLRPVDGDGNGSAICDIGAYEYGSIVPWLYLPVLRR